MLYGWAYPNLLLVLMILMTYSCIAPLLSFFCALYFAAAYAMYKSQLLLVFADMQQSHGQLWPAVVSCSMASLLLSNLTMLVRID